MKLLISRPTPLVAGALLLVALVLGGSASVRAQIAAGPESLAVALAPGDSATRIVTLTNTGNKTVPFCLSFEHPLQRAGTELRLSGGGIGGACGPLGEILHYADRDDAQWNPYGLTMTPDGRLFAADRTVLWLTFELTPELAVVRSFEHPTVAELSPFPTTSGVTFNPDTGTLWWLNGEYASGDLRRALLLEGALDGEATGRQIELPVHRLEGDTLYPVGLSYDPATARYYSVVYFDPRDSASSAIWAVDSLGGAVDGYPIEQRAYPGVEAHGFGLDAHGGTEVNGAAGAPEAVRVELALAPGNAFDRLVVVDPLGVDQEAETPLPDVSGGSGFGSIEGSPLRSRVDPNGVLYFPFVNFNTRGIVGIRPHPLPPSWLSVSAWDGTLGPGESVEIALTFSSGTRAIGNSYSSALQVFEAETGNTIEVPLSFEVVPETDAEEGSDAPAEPSLEVFPNPAEGNATVAISLPERADLRVEVYDVLGREVVVLHEGPLAAGRHRFGLATAGLPSGVYLVRATGLDFQATQRFSFTR